MQGKPLNKEAVIGYKQQMIQNGYAVRSINSMLASLNSLVAYLEWRDLKVKALRVQREAFCPEEKELTRTEYQRLCRTAQEEHNERLALMLQTLGSTGIRVSELAYITLEAVKKGKAVVSLKGKTRVIILLKQLQKKLLRYCGRRRITGGAIFVTRNGKPLNRSNIWREMKALCRKARVDSRKVFPHNLRHLFARTFYGIQKDIVKLADILGHSNINTTRIYMIATDAEHRECMERMHLLI